MKQQRGFTIIELLVALAIFSAILAVTLTAFDQGVNTWKRSLKGMSQQQYMLKRERWFYPLFEQAISAEYIYSGGTIGSYFQGSATEMQFNSAAPILTGPGRPALVALRITKEDTGYKLEYRQKFNADIQRGVNWADENWFALFEKMKSIRFEYLAGAHLPFDGNMASVAPHLKEYYRESPAWQANFSAKMEESLPLRVGIRLIDSNDKSWMFEFPVTHFSDALSPMFGRGA